LGGKLLEPAARFHDGSRISRPKHTENPAPQVLEHFANVKLIFSINSDAGNSLPYANQHRKKKRKLPTPIESEFLDAMATSSRSRVANDNETVAG
jgi:hypothetical protein